MNFKNIVIGFIVYEGNTSKYLPYFLDSVFAQTHNNFKILVIDNSKNKKNQNSKYIKKNYPQINLQWTGKNLGFTCAYNIMINSAIEMNADYFLIINPDTILDSEMLENMFNTMQSDKEIAVVSPKILKWDFKSKEKTNIVDSYGLSISKDFCFHDISQGEKDFKFSTKESIFGFTGAAALLNLKALQDVKFRQEYFDELMFMYKEDCDLSVRLYLSGWKTIFDPKAIVHHDRTIAKNGSGLLNKIINRNNRSKQVKKWSFLNHWIILLKYRNISVLPVSKIKIFYYQLQSLIFITVFETYLLKELVTLFRIRKKIKEKRLNLFNI